MQAKPALTADFCLQVVINCTPFPSRFEPTDEPSEVQLFDLGVVDPTSSAIFATAVKGRIFPWQINTSTIASGRDATVQAAADSIQTGAF
jgi:hypothetical protein